MTATVMNTDSVRGRTKAKKLWRVIAGWAIALLFIVPALVVLAFQSASFSEANPITWENWAYYGGCFGGLLAFALLSLFVAWMRTEYSLPNRVNDFGEALGRAVSRVGHAVGLTGVHIWFLLWALIPCIVVGLVHQQPHQLHTPTNHVRLMDDGRVISAGSAIESSRYLASSVLIPLRLKQGWLDDLSEELMIETPDGRITLTAHVDFVLRDGPALARMLQQNSSRVQSAHEAREFFRGEVNTYLSAAAVPLITDLQSGKAVPNYTVRLTQLLSESETPKPDWLGYIVIGGVEIIVGELQYR